MNLELMNGLSIVSADVMGLFICYYFFNGILEERKMKYYIKSISLFVLCFSLIGFEIFIQGSMSFIVISIVIYTFMIFIFFIGNVWVKLFSGFIIVLFGMISELFAVLLIEWILGIKFESIQKNVYIFAMGTFLSKLIMLMSVQLILKVISKKHIRLPSTYGILLMAIPVISICMIFEMVNNNLGNPKGLGKTAFFTLGLSCINIIVAWIYEAITTKIEEISRYEYSNQQFRAQEEYYKSIVKSQYDIRRISHDVKNHYISIQSMIKLGKGDEALKYISTVQNDESAISFEVISGNTIIDSLLSNKKQKAKSLNIKLEHEIAISNELHIDPVDLCIVLGNALDNAIEACEKILCENIEKIIKVKIKNDSNNLYFHITNPVTEKSLKSGSRFISTKGDYKNHGYGIINIQRSIQKNHGNLVIDIRNNMFDFNAIIPI